MATPSRYSSVVVKSRCAFPIKDMIQFDGETFDFEPFEAIPLPIEVARHCILKSRIQLDPVTLDAVYLLYEVKAGEPEPAPLTWDEGHPTDILDRTHMPPTNFDDDGNPLAARALQIGFPTAMFRGRNPGGLAAAGVTAQRLAAGPTEHGLGPVGPMAPEMRARLNEAHERMADAVAGQVEGDAAGDSP